ncbi:MAG: DNA polymerase elongation subunit (family B), partial [Thermoplasmata archaeon]|nr:DNA polymerase elongation subunit (family B) [Thermoplasmata archaeon]
MLLNISNNYLYTDTEILPIRDFHNPYFLVLGSEKERQLLDRALGNGNEILDRIIEVGKVEDYISFSRPGKKIKVFKVYTDESRVVPAVSNHLFFQLGLFTAEHDIPYIQRAASDLAVEGKWLFDTKGKEKELRVLCYDIETPRFGTMGSSAPVEIIGFTEFDVSFSSYHDLDTEEFKFDLHDISGSWETDEPLQLQARGGHDEIDVITQFLKSVKNAHIISGHNILSFDNHYLNNRIKVYLDGREGVISRSDMRFLNEFRETYTRPENFFTFGRKSTGIHFYPISLDTYHAALRFYRFLNSFALKELAKFFDIRIYGREYIDLGDIGAVDWERLMRYNRHDVVEQAGVTRIMLQQTLPLAFSTGMPVEMLLSSGTTKVWDYMT